jgi:glycosyltransferase involved in cell wall biosynthesis
MTGGRPTLGVLVITFNEEENIGRCIESVRFADRIVVVDSRSTDRTVEIARRLGADVHVHVWRGYAAQKALALGYLESDWVLWIDADEAVSPELRDEILAALASAPAVNGFRVPRMVHYLGRWMRHGGWYPDPKLRLFRRSAGRFDDKLVHEGVVVSGEIRFLEHPLHHYPYRDREHHRRKIETYARLAAEEMRRVDRRPAWYDLWLRPPIRFLRMFIVDRGFLDGLPGLFAARMAARYVRLKYRYARRAPPRNGERPEAAERIEIP